MIKKVTLSFYLLVCSLLVQSQEILSLKFEGRDSQGAYIVKDHEEEEPTKLFADLGFTTSYPGLQLSEAGQGNHFMGCTSSYVVPAKADKWLILQNLSIPVGARGYVLEWESRTCDPQKRDGLQVFISTTGGKGKEDFPEIPAWGGEEETVFAKLNVVNGDLVKHAISLDDYAGKTISIAFVNNSFHKSLILLDNIWVGEREAFRFEVKSDEYVAAPEIEITGQITAVGAPINSYTVHYSCNGHTYSKVYRGLNVHSGDKHTFIFDEKLDIKVGEKVEYKVWVKVDESESDKQTVSTTRISYFPKRNVVVEEGTESWCRSCPQGIWAMRYMYENYKDDGFIGIAIHNEDPFTDKEYDKQMGFTSFPSAVVNRKYLTSRAAIVYPGGDKVYLYDVEGKLEPSTFVDYFLIAQKERTLFEVVAEGTFNADSTIIEAKATVKSMIPVENKDYRIVFVVVENGLPGVQMNAFTNYPCEVGGFEKLPPACKVIYDDVARGIWPNLKGDKNSIPSSLEMEVPVEYRYTIDLSSKKIVRPGYLELIAMLINAKTGEILNSDKKSMTSYAHNDITGIKESHSQAYVRENNVCVKIDSGDSVYAELYDISGRKIGEARGEGNSEITVSGNGYEGVVFLRVHYDRNIFSSKLCLQR